MGNSPKIETIFFRESAFFPPLEYFFKLVNSDLWFVIDHTIFTPRSEQNHCRLRSQSGVTSCTVPTQRPCIKPIYQTQINNCTNWQKQFLKSIKSGYSKTPYFNLYYPNIRYIAESPNLLIRNLNMRTIFWVADLLDKDLEIAYTSQYYHKWNKTKVIQLICDKFKAEEFNKPFNPPVYDQRSDGFVPNLSVLDALFCIGATATKKLLSVESFLTV